MSSAVTVAPEKRRSAAAVCQANSHLNTQAPEEQGCVVMVAVTLCLHSFPSVLSARLVFGKKTNDALGRSAVKFNDWL